MSQQLVKKGTNGRMVNINPKSWIEAIKDKNTGQTLVEILQGFNMYFLPYNGNTSSTRCLVPTMLRKKGLWITYVKYDGNVYTEWYAADELDDKSWGDSSNWRIGNNTLVGDITISANGNWVINGTETEFKAVGEKGNTPLLRVANNRLQVSYDLGDTYRDVTNNPVYTKFRWLATTGDTQANNVGRIQASVDEGKTWTNMSNDFTNNLHIKKYIGINESLPTSGIAEGTIYAKGPYYAEGDTLNDNPIYRLWVYAWKGNTLAWQDNGEFTGIAAGVVQETGDSETEVMSQKAVSEKLSELGQEIGKGIYTINTIKGKSTLYEVPLNTELNSVCVRVNAKETQNYAFYVKYVGDSNYTKLSPIKYISDLLFTTNNDYLISQDKEFEAVRIYLGPDTTRSEDIQFIVNQGLSYDVCSEKVEKIISTFSIDNIKNVFYQTNPNYDVVRVRLFLHKDEIIGSLKMTAKSGYQISFDYIGEDGSIKYESGFKNEIIVEPTDIQYPVVRLNVLSESGTISKQEVKDNVHFEGLIVTEKGVGDSSELDRDTKVIKTINAFEPFVKNAANTQHNYNSVESLNFQRTELVKRVIREFDILKDSPFSLYIKTNSEPYKVALVAFDDAGVQLYDSGWGRIIDEKNKIIENAVRLRLVFAYLTSDFLFEEQTLNTKVDAFSFSANKGIFNYINDEVLSLSPIKHNMIIYNNVSELGFSGEDLVTRVERYISFQKNSPFNIILEFTLETGFNVALIALDNNGNSVYDSGWKTRISFKNHIIENATTIKLLFARFYGDNTFKENDINSNVLRFSFSSLKKEEIVEKEYPMYILNGVASLNFQGTETVKRVYKDFYIIKEKPFSIDISSIDSGWNLALTAYNKAGQKIYDSGWKTSISHTDKVIEDAERLRLVFAYFVGDYTFTENDLNEAISLFSFKAYKKEVESDTFNAFYFGRKINLNVQKVVDFEFVSKEILRVLYEGESTEIQRRNQSLAIANGRVFAIGDNNYRLSNGEYMPNNIKVYDYNTMSEIATANTGITNTHHNNAQFTDVYYNTDDSYPLMLLSRGDYEENGSPYQEFYVMRVTESSGSFVFQKIKTITCNVDNVRFNGSWVYDSVKEMLYMYTYTNGSWRVTENNNMCIFAFKLSVDVFKSSEPLTLNDSDVKYRLVLPYCIMQGAACQNGKLYMPVQRLASINGYENVIGTNTLIVINTDNGSVESAITLANQALEPEGIAIYDNKLYVSYHDGLATENIACLTIEEYKFT